VKKIKSELFSSREVAAALNNAVVITSKPGTGEIPDTRKRKLREYAQASIEISLVHVDDGILSSEEAAYVFACAALYIHTKHVQGSDKLPASKQVKELLEQ
jgi:hypothetical protein